MTALVKSTPIVATSDFAAAVDKPNALAQMSDEPFCIWLWDRICSNGDYDEVEVRRYASSEFVKSFSIEPSTDVSDLCDRILTAVHTDAAVYEYGKIGVGYVIRIATSWRAVRNGATGMKYDYLFSVKS